MSYIYNVIAENDLTFVNNIYEKKNKNMHCWLLVFSNEAAGRCLLCFTP